MIIRRVAHTLKRQDWPTFIAEILIVVIGILIGLQVDDWVTRTQDRRDEQLFLQRLHADIQQADELSARVRDRRLSSVDSIISAIGVMFDQAGPDELTASECLAVGNSNVFNINVPSIPAYEELIGVGRLEILSDQELRSALVRLDQARSALSTLLVIQSSQSAFTHLPAEFPELVQITNYVDESGEVRIRASCNLEDMRDDPRFLSQWAINADGYDAFVRDGLAPWLEQFLEVHRLVDNALGIEHSDGAQGET